MTKKIIFLLMLLCLVISPSLYGAWYYNPFTEELDYHRDNSELDDYFFLLDGSNDPLTGTLTTQTLLPSADNYYQVGLSSFRYSAIHAPIIYNDYLGYTIIPLTNNNQDIGSLSYGFKDLHIANNAYIYAMGRTTLAAIDNQYDLGSLSYRFRGIYVANAYMDYLGKTLLAGTDNTYDIGSSAYSFKDIYADGTSYIGTVSTANITSSIGTTSFGTTNITTTGNVNATNIVATGVTLTGTIAANLLSDGTLQITGGNLTTATGTVTAEQLTSTDDLTVVDTASIDGTMTLSSGSITDGTGAISFGTANITIGGSLTVSGDITVTGIQGSVKPATDLVYELGGENKRYSRTCTKEVLFDPDTKMIFDGNFLYIYVNGVEYARWGLTAAHENVVFGGENVIYNAEQVIF